MAGAYCTPQCTPHIPSCILSNVMHPFISTVSRPPTPIRYTIAEPGPECPRRRFLEEGSLLQYIIFLYDKLKGHHIILIATSLKLQASPARASNCTPPESQPPAAGAWSSSKYVRRPVGVPTHCIALHRTPVLCYTTTPSTSNNPFPNAQCTAHRRARFAPDGRALSFTYSGPTDLHT